MPRFIPHHERDIILPRRRRRTRVPLLLAVASAGAAALIYTFGAAWYQARGNEWISPADLYVPRFIDVVITAWLLWVGSSVGSFLNVVAWRMPRGESLNGRSYCPRCQTQLKARDNFPVFGWLALGGRCRICRLPISARYPIVEAIVAISLALVGIGELYHRSLPNQTLHWHAGPLWTPTFELPMLLTLLYHSVSLASAWAVGLVRINGDRLPKRLISFVIAAAAVPMLAYPTLMIVPWQTVAPENWWPDGLYLDALMRVVTAVAAAVLIGRFLASGLCPQADPKLDPLGRGTARLIDLIIVLAVPAIVVGWQAAAAIAVLASLIALALQRWLPNPPEGSLPRDGVIRRDALGRFAIAMPVALTLQIVFWRTLHQAWYWPSVDSSPWVILASFGLLLLVPLWLRDEVTSCEEADGPGVHDCEDRGRN